jgi:imidazole glycerol-phosphate synthase subunit HisH
VKIAIVQYNAGNVQSVQYALQRLGIDAVITGDAPQLQEADKVIFPGVGNAASAMEHLKRTGLDKVIVSLRQPVLGICLGLQLMCRESEEGNTGCLGIFDVSVKKFRVPGLQDHNSAKIPQMGWNTIQNLSSPLFAGIPENSFVYYVHSYYAALSPETIAVTDYTIPYSAAIAHGNFYGVQFHSEKSADVGLAIISNFLNIT